MNDIWIVVGALIFIAFPLYMWLMTYLFEPRIKEYKDVYGKPVYVETNPKVYHKRDR